jgi:protoheme IX farnesyltransferase
MNVKLFLELSKSGIVTLVVISVIGGYLCGHPFDQPFDWTRFFLTALGLLSLSSGSSALNQWSEQSIDLTMDRTKNRPLPSGRITSGQALLFIFITLLLGMCLLSFLSPVLALMGLTAILCYNVLYTLWWKKHWAFAAIPGAIPGALPIWMGHYAASGHLLSRGGVYLFALLFFWQMPHFWVLAIKYRQDYEKGGIPTLPVVIGEGLTSHQIIIWCLGYVALALGAPLFLPIGSFYLLIAILMSAILLYELRKYILDPNTKSWLRFFLWVNFSLIGYIFGAVIDLWSIYLIQYFR